MSHANWGDIPTWVTAVATIAAAVGAYFAARAAFQQLKGQREEIERQSLAQARLAELQARQLEQLDQQAALLRRSQAVRVDFKRVSITAHVSGPGDYEGVHVVNDSDRPIRDIAARMVTVMSARTLTTADGSLVAPHAQRLSPFVGHPDSPRLDEDPFKPIKLVRRGETAYMVWPYAYGTLGLQARVRFTDDAGIRWELDQDMHLAETTADPW